MHHLLYHLLTALTRIDSTFSHLSSTCSICNTNQLPLRQSKSRPFMSLATINSHFSSLDCTSPPPFLPIFLVLFFKFIPFHSLMLSLWLGQILHLFLPSHSRISPQQDRSPFCIQLPYLMLELYIV